MRDFLLRFLTAKPGFIRLINAVFAVLVAFQAIEVTAEQFGVVVLAVEALFSYASQLAFQRDVEDLGSMSNQYPELSR